MTETFSFDYFGSTVNAKSLGADIIPPIQETLTSHCVPFTATGKIVAVHVIGRGIDIPGDHIDTDETAIEAMQREAQEEAQITVINPILIDVWHLSSSNEKLGLTQKPYLLLYSVDVDSIDSFIPNNEVNERLLLDSDAFIASYFGDSKPAQIMISKALAVRA